MASTLLFYLTNEIVVFAIQLFDSFYSSLFRTLPPSSHKFKSTVRVIFPPKNVTKIYIFQGSNQLHECNVTKKHPTLIQEENSTIKFRLVWHKRSHSKQTREFFLSFFNLSAQRPSLNTTLFLLASCDAELIKQLKKLNHLQSKAELKSCHQI